jgi:hypothetical protein
MVVLAMPLPLETPEGRLYVSPNMPVGDGGLPVQQPMTETPVDDTPMGQRILDRLLGTNGQERYQLWPEKLVRDALSAPHDVLNSKVPSTSGDLIKPALDVSALAGTGGLAGVSEGGAAALGAGPFLRPALKYEGKIYKAPMGGEHMDAIPADLRPEFTRQAMSGEDISNFNFGFMNHKGHFLNREDALKYAIDEGLMSPHDAKFGALTSTLMADSSKPAIATKEMESLLAKKNNVQMNSDAEVLKNPSKKDIRDLAKDSESIRTFTDKDGNLYAWDGAAGTHEGIANSLGLKVDNWGHSWDKHKGKLSTDITNSLGNKGYPNWLVDGMRL